MRVALRTLLELPASFHLSIQKARRRGHLLRFISLVLIGHKVVHCIEILLSVVGEQFPVGKVFEGGISADTKSKSDVPVFRDVKSGDDDSIVRILLL